MDKFVGTAAGIIITPPEEVQDEEVKEEPERSEDAKVED